MSLFALRSVLYLTEAQKWFDHRSQDLSDQERKFITASRAVAERRRQQQAAAAKSLRGLSVAYEKVGNVLVAQTNLQSHKKI